MIRISLFIALLAGVLVAAGCDNRAETKKAGPQAALITVTQSGQKNLEVLEETVGRLESLIDPRISAEVAGRVVKVMAGAGQAVKAGQTLALLDARDVSIQRQASLAEASRIEALLANQRRIVERNQRLVQSNFVSQNAVDDALAQQKALEQQLAAARAQLAASERSLDKTRVVAPIDGRIETQIVAVGDYVKVGDPLFHLVSVSRLRAHLPFPEGIAPRLKVGQTVRLTTPTMPGQVVTGKIEDIKPMVGSASRAVDTLVRLENQAGWKPGASVNGQVIIEEKPGTVVVPEQSVVLRPAGKVVYVIKDNKALARVVETGVRQAGLVEIVKGLRPGETVALDGAGFLTDQAAVTIKGEPAKAAAAPAPANKP
ncbi:MAG: efflux RND transporter periplasmic adaptor subunit [Betaproteobacteria bacterium]|nr:efflux RND transporter periplasmic adaptor subunit [Betaproteobacteria bacterium]